MFTVGFEKGIVFEVFEEMYIRPLSGGIIARKTSSPVRFAPGVPNKRLYRLECTASVRSG